MGVLPERGGWNDQSEADRYWLLQCWELRQRREAIEQQEAREKRKADEAKDAGRKRGR